jgi:hypothetical protein
MNAARLLLAFFPSLAGLAGDFRFSSGDGEAHFKSVTGDPLYANKDQRISFAIAYKKRNYSKFDFIFKISLLDSNGEKATLYRLERNFFKVDDGDYEAAFTIPGYLLLKDAELIFDASLEYNDTNRFGGVTSITYEWWSLSAVPKEEGKTHSYFASGEDYNDTVYSYYYPGLGYGNFSFFGVQDYRLAHKRSLCLNESGFYYHNFPFDPLPSGQIGELRIYSSPSYWRIGEMVGKKYRSIPLGCSKSEYGYYVLCLLDQYYFSRETGEMSSMKTSLFDVPTRDLILPHWAKKDNPLKLTIVLENFNSLGDTYSFDKLAYYEGAYYHDYEISWGEK